jgi:hypothetical protein
VPNSLLAGKKAGNFSDSAVFCENPSRKRPRIQPFVDEFPKRRAGNYFGRAGNLFRLLDSSREFGAKPIRPLPRINGG